jgi:hypothetical protein
MEKQRRHYYQLQHKWLDLRSVKFQGLAPANNIVNYPPVAQGGNQSQTGNVNQSTQGSTASSYSGQSGGQQQGTTAGIYSPQQQAAQGTTGTAITNYLNTGILPGNFGNDAQQDAAYNSAYQQYVAPQLAAQYGAGSPAIGAQEAQGLQQLNANLYSTQLGAFNNATNQAMSYGFTPTGTTNTGTESANQSGTQASNWQGSNNQALSDLTSLSNITASLSGWG